MTLKEKIQDELKASLKGRQELKTATLRMLTAAILNKEKEKRARLVSEDTTEEQLSEEGRLTNEEVMEVVASEAKKRREAISEFRKGNRKDLVEKEELELKVLENYLPEQLPKEEVKELAKKTIDKIGATDSRDMGKVMAVLMPQLKGKAEGELVSKIVKELLSQKS